MRANLTRWCVCLCVCVCQKSIAVTLECMIFSPIFRFTNTYASSSRSVVMSLSSGDEVWVRNGFTTPIELHGNGFTTFSGWLLRQ